MSLVGCVGTIEDDDGSPRTGEHRETFTKFFGFGGCGVELGAPGREQVRWRRSVLRVARGSIAMVARRPGQTACPIRFSRQAGSVVRDRDLTFHFWSCLKPGRKAIHELADLGDHFLLA